MYLSYIRYVIMFVLNFYFFIKILNIKKPSIKKHLIFFSASVFLAFFTSLTTQINPNAVHISIVIFVLISALIMKILYNLEIIFSITSMIISFGINLIIYFFSVTILSTIYAVFLKQVQIISKDLIFLLIMYVILCIIFFRIKRIKNGFPFLYNKKVPYLDVFLSTLIILSYSLINGIIQSKFFLLLANFLVITIFTILIILWKKQITKTYIERQKQRELKYLYAQIDEYEKQLTKLRVDNEKLSSIIHKDNKLIPAIENAVFSMQGSDTKESKKILNELKDLTKERLEIIQAYKYGEKNTLPKTGYFLIDAMNDYMFKKAAQSNIEYKLEIDTQLKAISSGMISEKDFCTILSDLIENAIISVNETDIKAIRIKLIVLNGYDTIIVSDSGIMFEPKVICSLGQKKITTREKGSGIGIMSLFQIKQRCQASVIIREYFNLNKKYAKDFIVVFDHMNIFQIESPRFLDLKKSCLRSDIVLCDLSDKGLGFDIEVENPCLAKD